MKADFLIQPDAPFRLGDFLTTGLQDPKWTHFAAAAAFVKRSGTKHIRDQLRAFVDRGGEAVVTAGVDAGGTSLEGLGDLVAAVGDAGRVCAFRNANNSTFHPKIFMFSNADAAEAVIGSGNLTEGGLFTNYEANLRVYLDLANPEHAVLHRELTAATLAWSTPKEGLCYDLNAELLARLHAEGLVPDEATARREGQFNAIDGKVPGEQSLFAKHAVQAAPKVAGMIEEAVGDAGADDDGDPDLVVETPEPVAPQPGINTVFLMTLQRTDVGVGQTTAGAARRSPEIFIPLIARDTDPKFWGWPSEFEADAAWTGPKDGDGRGKMDRPGVMVRLGGAIFPVHFWYNPDKRDFRMRSEDMRSAGAIGDILYVERSNGAGGFHYYVDVVPQGSPKHVDYLARCTTPVRNSKKLFGYF